MRSRAQVQSVFLAGTCADDGAGSAISALSHHPDPLSASIVPAQRTKLLGQIPKIGGKHGQESSNRERCP